MGNKEYEREYYKIKLRGGTNIEKRGKDVMDKERETEGEEEEEERKGDNSLR